MIVQCILKTNLIISIRLSIVILLQVHLSNLIAILIPLTVLNKNSKIRMIQINTVIYKKIEFKIMTSIYFMDILREII